MTYFAQEKDLKEMKEKPLSEKVHLEQLGIDWLMKDDVKEAVENFEKDLKKFLKFHVEEPIHDQHFQLLKVKLKKRFGEFK